MSGQIFRNPEEGSGGDYAHPQGCTCREHQTNEAAERLRKTLAADGWKDTDLDLALAAERRATVERIRERLERNTWTQQTGIVLRILDEEAAR